MFFLIYGDVTSCYHGMNNDKEVKNCTFNVAFSHCAVN